MAKVFNAFDEDGEVNEDADGEGGWFVRIVLGKDVSRNSTIVLNYNDVTVQRGLTSDEYPVPIEAFSGPSDETSIPPPQFPVDEQEKNHGGTRGKWLWYGHVQFDNGASRETLG